MKIDSISNNNYANSNRVNFKAQIFHQKEIFKTITDADSRMWDLGQKFEHIKSIRNGINEIKKMGDPDTGISLLQNRVTINHHNCWYNTRIINKKFPDVAFYHAYDNNKGFWNISYLDFFKQKTDDLKDCIETFEKKFLKHVCNLAQQEPPKVLEMFNIKDEHWAEIADKIKGKTGYYYIGIEKDREVFNQKYLKYLLKHSLKEQ